MGILVAFTPFIAFAIVYHVDGRTAGLIIAAATSAMFLLRDRMVPDRTPKQLEIGMAILFGGLLLYSLLAGPTWSVVGLQLIVDAGLLLIMLASLVFGQPFTLPYAREHLPRHLWDSPEVVRSNYVVTAAWVVAFALMGLANCALLLAPQQAAGVDVLVTTLAGAGAWWFTCWYPGPNQAMATL
jgi:hypothetical protein